MNIQKYHLLLIILFLIITSCGLTKKRGCDTCPNFTALSELNKWINLFRFILNNYICKMQCLAELPIGSIGEMVRIFDNNLEQKLLEMGCTPGENFKVIRKAPFGGPVAILISSYILSIRREDAKSIEVIELRNE